MAERPGPSASRGWIATLATGACVAAEVAVSAAHPGAAAGLGALLVLAAAAVALSLRQAFSGLGASRALRAAVVGSIAFTVALTVVNVLEAHAR